MAAREPVLVRCHTCRRQGYLWRSLLGFQDRETCIICNGTGKVDIGSKPTQEERAKA